MKRPKRGILFTVVLMIVLVCFASTAVGKVTLNFQGWEASPLETESVRKGIALFESRNPDIKVEYIPCPWSEHHSKLLILYAGDAAPDVAFVAAEPFYREFVKRGVLLDITEPFYEELKLEDFIPIDREKMVVNGKIYGISSCVVAGVLFSNTNLYDEAGLDYPPRNVNQAWKWDEFIDVAEKLTLTDTSGKVTQYGSYGLEAWFGLHSGHPLILSNEGRLFNDDYTKCLMDQPAAVEVVQKMADVKRVHKASPDAFILQNIGMNAAQMLETGRIATLFDGSWSLQLLATLDFPIQVGVLPVFKKPVSVGTAHVHSAFKATEHPEEAWKFVKFLSSEEYQVDLIRAGLWMPNRLSLYTPQGMERWLNPEVYPEGYEGIAEYFRDYLELIPYCFIPQEVQDIIEEETQLIWTDEKQAVEPIMKRLVERVNAVLAEQ
jgi:multiple sugar transport system substrate-binding protein